MSAAGEILTLRVAEITVPKDRFRALKVDQARAIGAAILADGQYDPIAVTRLPGHSDYQLVDGWHRLEGCRFAGLDTIEARLVSYEPKARIWREVLSGIARASEDVFDRAAAIDALARLAREEAGLPAAGDLRRSGELRALKVIQDEADGQIAIIANSLRWDLKLAEQLGVGARNIRNLAVIHERIPAKMKDQLRKLGQAEKLVPLLKFAALLPYDMERLLHWLKTADEPDLAEGLAWLAGPSPASPVEKQQNALFGKAAKWSPRERASFFAQWTSAYHPDGRAIAANKGRADA
ncbi:MAG: ParB N-terminal domain-containing protein [Sandarakinorhabdus sp.]|nr:ParB N-terminal domain-containing protein [Sandarakinorhabdus sp.]